MIQPNPKDIGRMVRIERSNGQPEVGKLIEVCRPDMQHERPYAMVQYRDIKKPVATFLDKLSWSDSQLL